MNTSRFKQKLKTFEREFITNKDSINELSERLYEICNEINWSWSGSCLDTHWDLYYQDFEKPPSGRSFNIEWGLVNGMPNGWAHVDGKDVEETIQERFSDEETLKAFTGEIDRIVDLAEEVQGECEVLEQAINHERFPSAKILCDRIRKDVATDAKHNVAKKVLGGTTTRDSRAAMSNRRGTPVHIWFMEYANRGISLTERGLAFIENCKHLLDDLSTSPQSRLDEHAIINIIDRFHVAARQLSTRQRYSDREGIDINDEYDVQDLLESYLRLFFEDVRPEEYTPSTAGKSSRIDFLLVEDQVAIEVKYCRQDNAKKKIRDELLVDVGTYKQHPKVKTLIGFVYDPKELMNNPRGFEADFENLSDAHLGIRCFIRP